MLFDAEVARQLAERTTLVAQLGGVIEQRAEKRRSAMLRTTRAALLVLDVELLRSPLDHVT